jgi:hypothetical protein
MLAGGLLVVGLFEVMLYLVIVIVGTCISALVRLVSGLMWCLKAPFTWLFS